MAGYSRSVVLDPDRDLSVARVPRLADVLDGEGWSNAGRAATYDPETGEVTFTLDTSGDTDMDDGVGLVFRLRDVGGRLIGETNPNTVIAEKLLTGLVQYLATTLPTPGNGVNIAVGVSWADPGDTVARRAAWAALHFESPDPRGEAGRLGPTVVSLAGNTGAGAVGCALGGFGFYAISPDCVALGADGTPVGQLATIGISGLGSVVGEAPRLFIAAWREGASVGVETATVKLSSLVTVVDTTRTPGAA